MRKHLFFPLIFSFVCCSAFAQNAITLNVLPPPIPTANAGSDTNVTSGSLIVLQGNAGGGTAPLSYQWSPSLNMPNSTILTPSVNVTQPTVFTLTVTDANNCVVTDSVFVDVVMSTESFNASMFRLFPNPAKDILTIEHPLEGEFEVKLTNVLGQVVHNQMNSGQSKSLQLEVGKFPSGSYMLSIIQGSQQVSMKVVVQ